MTSDPTTNFEAKVGAYVGEYRLTKRLGAGGFASVWQGENSNGEKLAFKILHPRHILKKRKKGPSIPDRFLDEARVLINLNIPGVVQVRSYVDERQEGLIAYTMELLDGTDLSNCFLDLKGIEIVEIFAVVCETLAKLHERNILHRDIKSANIFVSKPDKNHNRIIKLIDFGVAKVLQAKSLMESTATGVIVGTIQTLPPESIRRLNGEDQELTWSVDQWGIGVALYHCLSSRLPFNDPAVLTLIDQIQNQTTPPLILRHGLELGNVEKDMEALIERCLAKSPNDRYPSMLSVADELRGLVAKSRGQKITSKIPLAERVQESVRTVPPDGKLISRERFRMSNTNKQTIDDRSGRPEDETRHNPALSQRRIQSSPTELALTTDSAETILPAAPVAVATRHNSDTEPNNQRPDPRRESLDIAFAPVGKTGQMVGQDPTLRAEDLEQNSVSESFGVADTLPSVPKAPQPASHRPSPPTSASVNGVPLGLTLIIVGLSIIISFTLGWYLRGL